MTNINRETCLHASLTLTKEKRLKDIAHSCVLAADFSIHKNLKFIHKMQTYQKHTHLSSLASFQCSTSYSFCGPIHFLFVTKSKGMQEENGRITEHNDEVGILLVYASNS